MNLNDLDFLIFSSHKTATQTLLSTINCNNFKTIHCHSLYSFIITLPTYKGEISNETFIQALTNYKNINNKKIKILSIIRNPKDRLISSFFQTFSSDEVNFHNKNEKDSTFGVKSVEELCIIYENLINKKKYPFLKESIDEISVIFKINIINNLEKKENYYYFNHDLFELYVLDFNKLIKSDSHIYINKIIGTNFIYIENDNLSQNKNYYDKYINLKKMLGTKLDNIIEKRYDYFYFTAFNHM
jgi:hypothetical protein